MDKNSNLSEISGRDQLAEKVSCHGNHTPRGRKIIKGTQGLARVSRKRMKTQKEKQKKFDKRTVKMKSLYMTNIEKKRG